MRTLLYKQIEKFQIITGFSQLTPDPVETKKKIIPLLLDDPKIKRIGELIIQKGRLIEAVHQIYNIARNKKRKPDVMQISQIENYKKQIAEINQELQELEKYRQQKTNEYRRTNAVYFDPAPGEVVKPDEEIEILKDKFINLPKNYHLDINGNLIPDFSGHKYWIKNGETWKRLSYSFGETPNPMAIITEKLTKEEMAEISEQLEKERIALLSPADKEKEKERIINQLSREAVIKKEALEIQGVAAETAFAEAQEWYNEQVVLIEARYG